MVSGRCGPSDGPSCRLYMINKTEKSTCLMLGRTYELDEDIYIDVLEGSRKFDPLCRFHAPIAVSLSATSPAYARCSRRCAANEEGVRGKQKLLSRESRPTPNYNRTNQAVRDLRSPSLRAGVWYRSPWITGLAATLVLYSTCAAPKPYSKVYARVRD